MLTLTSRPHRATLLPLALAALLSATALLAIASLAAPAPVNGASTFTATPQVGSGSAGPAPVNSSM